MPPPIEHFEKLERLFSVLLEDSGPLFSDQELELTKEFIYHGEYGIALEEFAALVTTTQREISQITFDTIVSLSVAMEIAGSIDLESIEKLVAQ
jgi:hypothetical protein